MRFDSAARYHVQTIASSPLAGKYRPQGEIYNKELLIMKSHEAIQEAVAGRTTDHAKALGLASITVNGPS